MSISKTKTTPISSDPNTHPFLLQIIGINNLLKLEMLNYNCLMKNKEI